MTLIAFIQALIEKSGLVSVVMARFSALAKCSWALLTLTLTTWVGLQSLHLNYTTWNWWTLRCTRIVSAPKDVQMGKYSWAPALAAVTANLTTSRSSLQKQVVHKIMIFETDYASHIGHDDSYPVRATLCASRKHALLLGSFVISHGCQCKVLFCMKSCDWFNPSVFALLGFWREILVHDGKIMYIMHEVARDAWDVHRHLLKSTVMTRSARIFHFQGYNWFSSQTPKPVVRE